jgi:hypothetical protein
MNIRVRALANRQFYDPEAVLRRLRAVEVQVARSDTPDLIRRLRTNKLKTEREARDALLFAYGMGRAVAGKVWVAPGEVEDCDFVTKTQAHGTEFFSCVQLKELAPEDRNSKQTLGDLVAGLANLPRSDTVLAIRLNRRGQIPFAELATVRVPFAELWYFWSAGPDGNDWRLYGDAMGSPALYEFQYPN